MAATDKHATIEKLSEMVFSVRSVQRLYNDGQLRLEESGICGGQSASHAALPMVTSKFRPNIALPTLATILLMQPLQRHSNNKIPIICVAYTRRTSGHRLGTFKTGDIISSPPPNVVSLTTSPTSLSLSLSLLEESLDTAVGRVGSWSEMAASLGVSGVE
jgi:hypothetical protein